MKAKSLFIALGLASAGTLAYAYTEVVETMTVFLKDGSKVEYNVGDVTKVAFDSSVETVGLLITGADGQDLYRSQTLGTMFRVVAEDDAAPTQFVFGTAENTAELADLKSGKYMVRLDVANAALFQPDIDLAKDDSGVTLAVYEWTEGEISATHADVSKGTLTTSRNSKGVLTLELDVTMADGLSVRASYNGMPTDVSDLEVLFPTPGPKNEVNYFDKDGNLSQSARIVGFKKTTSTATPTKNHNLYTAVLDDAHDYITCQVSIDPEYVGKKIDLATLEKAAVTPVCSFKYNSIQIYGNNDRYGFSGLEGTIEVIENDDATVTINVDITNKYSNWGSAGGTPERVTLEYTGACEGLEIPAKNTAEYYNADGVLTNNLAITGITKKTSGNYLRYVMTFDDDDFYGSNYYIEFLPEFLGQEINFANYTEVPADKAPQFTFRFGSYIQVSGPNDQWRNRGIEGTMQIVENGDGTVTVKANVVNRYITGGSTTQGGSPACVIIDYKGACSGL